MRGRKVKLFSENATVGVGAAGVKMVWYLIPSRHGGLVYTKVRGPGVSSKRTPPFFETSHFSRQKSRDLKMCQKVLIDHPHGSFGMKCSIKSPKRTEWGHI